MISLIEIISIRDRQWESLNYLVRMQKTRPYLLPARILRLQLMIDKLTLLQAYKAMFEFLRDLYYREGKPDNLGSFLSDLQILEDNETADPASWQDWLIVVEKVLSQEQK